LLDLYRDSASPAASDTIGEIEFNGEDSAGNKQQYAVIHGSILSPTSTAETGQIHFETATAGASTEKMIIGSTNLVINDIGAIYNVRIEGDTDANLLYTDATNSRVGIGILTPAEKLDVVGNIKLSGNVVVASGFGIDFAATAGTGTSELFNDYEEGTWNGGVSFGNAVVGITYNNFVGYYTKIGNVVTLSGYINMLSKGSSAGSARITGLPFTCVNNASGYAAAALFFSNLTFSGQVGGYVNINATTIDLFQTTALGSASALADTNFANNTGLIVNVTYRVA
jgi:hypothetical protein